MKAFLRLNSTIIRMKLESGEIPLHADCVDAKWLYWNGKSVRGVGVADGDIPAEQEIKEFIESKTDEIKDCKKDWWLFYKTIKNLNYDR